MTWNHVEMYKREAKSCWLVTDCCVRLGFAPSGPLTDAFCSDVADMHRLVKRILVYCTYPKSLHLLEQFTSQACLDAECFTLFNLCLTNIIYTLSVLLLLTCDCCLSGPKPFDFDSEAVPAENTFSV
jgi:hypothetical protein